MSKTVDPLYYSELECPVCKNNNKFENIRAGSYSESGKDKDFKPTGRNWLNQAYQKFDPLLFFMATCAKCYYTREFNQDYKNWSKDTNFKTYRLKTIQQNHLSDLSQKDGIIRFLGENIDQQNYPFESAVIKLLLGIYDTKISGRPSNLDMGRYFLRIAWLFRDQAQQGQEEATGNAGFFRQLRGAASQVNQLVPSYDEKVANLKRMLENDFLMVFGNVPEADEHKKQIEQAISEINSTLEPLAKAGSKLMSLFGNAERTLLGQELSSDKPFHNYPGFTSFLLQAKEKWDEVPINEKEALIKATEYYQKAYESGGEISQGVQQIQAAYMIGELSRRTGNTKNADQFFNQTIRMGREMVMGKQADQSTINFMKNLLDIAMEQARLNKKQEAEVSA
jgi:hypothetical protein